jgi:hypothetical protein
MSQAGYNIPVIASSSKVQGKPDEDEEDALSAEPAGEDKWEPQTGEDNRDFLPHIARLALGNELCM